MKNRKTEEEEVLVSNVAIQGEMEPNHHQPDLGSLRLLSVVVPFTVADATCDLSVHPQFMANDITAFGSLVPNT